MGKMMQRPISQAIRQGGKTQKLSLLWPLSQGLKQSRCIVRVQSVPTHMPKFVWRSLHFDTLQFVNDKTL